MLNPCGQVVDYLRKCYVTRVRPFAGSDQTAVVRWFWAPPGAPVLKGAIWRSSAWYVQDIDGRYPPAPPIGEERSVPFVWSPGRLGQDLAVARCTVGDPAWFATGIPPSANVPNPPPLPACCVITPHNALGGWLLGGLMGPVGRLGRGGLRLGGELLRALSPAAGGLRLGGVGVLRLGRGGLRLGGVAGLVPLVGAGGLRLGGRAALAVARGGWRLGGVGRELMALLYCSLRLDGLFGVPDNTFTSLQWDTVEADPSGMFSAGTPSRVTVPVAGVYAVAHTLNWNTLGDQWQLQGQLRVNGTPVQTLYGGDVYNTNFAYLNCTAIRQMSAGDYLEVDALQHRSFGGGTLFPANAGILPASLRVAALGGAAGGGLIGVQRFTSSGTYTPTAGTNSVIVEVQGGGGGGGGASSPGASTGHTSLGSGGSGGGWCRVRLLANFAGAAVTVGAGGAGGAAGTNNGVNGGDSKFVTAGGSPVTYTGGGGAGGFSNPNQAIASALIAPGGGAATGGDDNVTGGMGGIALAVNTGWVGIGGSGGFSRYSPGVNGGSISAQNTGAAGNNAPGFGGGGSGAIVNQSAAAKAGGNGSGGLVIVYEYS